MNVLPFVIIFGVATSLAAVHKTLPYQVSSKLNMQVFSSQSSAEYLNSILNNVLLSENCPFHLGGKVFTLFTDIFLFYDFSVSGFIQNFKVFHSIYIPKKIFEFLPNYFIIINKYYIFSLLC